MDKPFFMGLANPPYHESSGLRSLWDEGDVKSSLRCKDEGDVKSNLRRKDEGDVKSSLRRKIM
jgi:hypothetical protein